MPDRAVFQHHHDGRTVRVELDGSPRPITVASPTGELTLTEHELEWLCQVGGPAALDAARRTRGERTEPPSAPTPVPELGLPETAGGRPQPLFESPMQRGSE